MKFPKGILIRWAKASESSGSRRVSASIASPDEFINLFFGKTFDIAATILESSMHEISHKLLGALGGLGLNGPQIFSSGAVYHAHFERRIILVQY